MLGLDRVLAGMSSRHIPATMGFPSSGQSSGLLAAAPWTFLGVAAVLHGALGVTAVVRPPAITRCIRFSIVRLGTTASRQKAWWFGAVASHVKTRKARVQVIWLKCVIFSNWQKWNLGSNLFWCGTTNKVIALCGNSACAPRQTRTDTVAGIAAMRQLAHWAPVICSQILVVVICSITTVLPGGRSNTLSASSALHAIGGVCTAQRRLEQMTIIGIFNSLCKNTLTGMRGLLVVLTVRINTKTVVSRTGFWGRVLKVHFVVLVLWWHRVSLVTWDTEFIVSAGCRKTCPGLGAVSPHSSCLWAWNIIPVHNDVKVHPSQDACCSVCLWLFVGIKFFVVGRMGSLDRTKGKWKFNFHGLGNGAGSVVGKVWMELLEPFDHFLCIISVQEIQVSCKSFGPPKNLLGKAFLINDDQFISLSPADANRVSARTRTWEQLKFKVDLLDFSYS